MKSQNKVVVFLVGNCRFETHVDSLVAISSWFRELFARENSPYVIDERPADFRKLLNFARGADVEVIDSSFERLLTKYRIDSRSYLESPDFDEEKAPSPPDSTMNFFKPESWLPVGRYLAKGSTQNSFFRWFHPKIFEKERYTVSPTSTRWVDKSRSQDVFTLSDRAPEHTWIVQDMRLRFRLLFRDQSADFGVTRFEALESALERIMLTTNDVSVDWLEGINLSDLECLRPVEKNEFDDARDDFELRLPLWQRGVRGSNERTTSFLPLGPGIQVLVDWIEECPYRVEDISLSVDLIRVECPQLHSSQTSVFPCLQWVGRRSVFRTICDLQEPEGFYEQRRVWLEYVFHRFVLSVRDLATRKRLRLLDLKIMDGEQTVMVANEREILEEMLAIDGYLPKEPVYSLRAPGLGLSLSRISDLRIRFRVRDRNSPPAVNLLLFAQTGNVNVTNHPPKAYPGYFC